MDGDPLATLSDSGPNRLMSLREIADATGKTYNTVLSWCRAGRLSKINGHYVRLKCWQTESGLVSCQQALVRFRQQLNEPLYSPSEDQGAYSAG